MNIQDIYTLTFISSIFKGFNLTGYPFIDTILIGIISFLYIFSDSRIRTIPSSVGKSWDTPTVHGARPHMVELRSMGHTHNSWDTSNHNLYRRDEIAHQEIYTQVDLYTTRSVP